MILMPRKATTAKMVTSAVLALTWVFFTGVGILDRFLALNFAPSLFIASLIPDRKEVPHGAR